MFEIQKGWAGFYPMLKKEDGLFSSSEHYIAEILDLTPEEYVELLMRNGGSEAESWYHYFETRKECQDFIEKFIEPRLIMNKLTE